MDTFDLRKFLKENKLKEGEIDKDTFHNIRSGRWGETGKARREREAREREEEDILINPEDLPGDEEGYITDDAGQRIKVREDRFEDVEHIFSGEEEGAQEAPAHITALAIAAEDAYEEMGNIDEVLKFVEMHLRGVYGE